MTPAQLELLRDAFTAVQGISDDRGYNHWAGIHGLPLPMYCKHGDRLFLPWHRAYLYFFELALRDQAPDASVPWWDWTVPGPHRSGLPRAFALARVDGARNPLAGAPVPPNARQGGQPTRTSRRPRPPRELPSPRLIERLLSLSDFDDFSTQLENVHGGIHVWVGGTMSMVPWAAYDPIFWAHHTMIDRLWRIWQLRHPGSGPSRDLLDRALPPFDMTVRQTLDVTALGYDYAVTTAHAQGNR
jgi:tyrosinase